MLAENGVELKLAEGALDFLSQVGYDPEFGARPVKRAIQRYLLNDLSKSYFPRKSTAAKQLSLMLVETDWYSEIKSFHLNRMPGMLDKKHTGIIYIPEYVNLRTSGWQFGWLITKT